MDYEKKYKESLLKAKEILKYYTDNKEAYNFLFPYVQEDIEGMFPELKENNDERIKK